MTTNDPLLKDLNNEQQEAVLHQTGPCLVIAGAGTGKTTVITRRIAYLIEKNLAKPEEVVALTFTDKAAKEMEERVDRLVAYGATNYTISTFHSFATEILRDYAYLIGLPTNFSLYTPAEEMVLARKVVFDFPFKTIKPGSDPSNFLKDFLQFIGQLKDENIQPKEFQEFLDKLARDIKSQPEEDQEELAIWQELSQAYTIYQKKLTETGALGFADLIPEALRLITDHPIVRKELEKKVKFLLIDEYQDTNWVQAELAHKLAEKTKNIFVVGDDDQAIYAFRGAALGNILSFSQRYPERKLYVLEKNYRASQEILDTAYRLIINNNPDRLEYSEKINKRLKSDRSGPSPRHEHCQSQIAEARFIAEEISRLIKDRYQYKDIAILVRSRAHAESIRTALKAADIPYQLLSDQRFYELEIIKQVLSYLRALTDPYNSVNLYYLLTSPIVGVSETELKKIVSQSHYQLKHLVELVKNDPKLSQDKQIDKFFTNFNQHLRLAKEDPTSALLIRILHDLGLYQRLIDQEKNSQKDFESLGQLFEIIVAFEERHLNARVEEFINYLDAVIASGQDIAPPDVVVDDLLAVKIMTVHQSKGLEFPVVFVPCLVTGRFPSRNKRDSFSLPEDLIKEKKAVGDLFIEEERRLFFVAMTRAKNDLIITSAAHYGEGKRLSKISPFVPEAFGDKAQTVPQTSFKAELFQLALPLDTGKSQVLRKTENNQPLTVSPSKLETYAKCPLMYRYQYVLKIHTLPSWQLNFGNSLHASLRAYADYQRTGQSLLEGNVVEELVERFWQTGGYENKTHEAKKKGELVNAIERFFQTPLGQKVPEVVERPFVFQLETKDKITGRIDRLDREKNGLVITDYKTSANEAYYNAKEDIQLTSYILAIQSQGEKVAKVGFVFPLIEKEQFALVEEIDIETTKTKIIDLVKSIRESLAGDDFPAKPSKINCDWCSYKQICPFRWRG